MKTLKPYANPQNAKKMRQSVFETVMKVLDCDTGEDLDTVGFLGEMNGNAVSFYGEMDSGYQLVVDDFWGRGEKMEPSEKQLKAMAKVLRNKVTELESLKENEERENAEWLEDEIENQKYGIEGALYCSFY